MTWLAMKRTKVILVFPQVAAARDDANLWVPYPLLTVATALIADGREEIVLFDENRSDDLAWATLLREHLADTLCVGFSVMTGGEQISRAMKMARDVKSRASDVPIVFGGPHVNVLADQTAEHPVVDVALAGPGQGSMPRFVRELDGGLAFEQVPGLVVKNKSGWTRGPANPPRSDRLGRYPWHLIDVARYVHLNPAIGSRTLNYVASQGCVYDCRFCYELTYNGKLSRMPADLLLSEIQCKSSPRPVGHGDRAPVSGEGYFDYRLRSCGSKTVPGLAIAARAAARR